MISHLPGLIVSRTIPADALVGVLTGTYKVFGGVIRDNAGRIVTHLATTNPVAASIVGSASLGLDGFNTYQLHKVSKGIGDLSTGVAALQSATSKIVGLARATTALSGLTLAVSAVGFVYLSVKLKRVDQKIDELAKDVKAVRTFLESQERATLVSSLKTLSGLPSDLDDKTRIPLLIDARQKLGEIHERYRDQLLKVERIEECAPIEEYYAITALGHARCSSELDMHDTAVRDLDDAYAAWLAASRAICSRLVMRDDPERLLTSVYAEVRTDEIVDWMDFANGTDKGIEWIDALRERATPLRLPQVRIGNADRVGIEMMRKLVARDQILQGYRSQQRYLATNRIRPRDFEAYVESLDPSLKVDDTFVFSAGAGESAASDIVA